MNFHCSSADLPTKNMAYLTSVTALALLVAIQCTCVYTSCSYPRSGNSYFLGQMRLSDAIKGRGKRNVIFPWTPTHSMILFRGKIFEWGINYSYYMYRNPSSCVITWSWSAKGQSRCSLWDVERWTRAYGRTHTYNILWDNCHMFVNRLAKYLNTNCGR